MDIAPVDLKPLLHPCSYAMMLVAANTDLKCLSNRVHNVLQQAKILTF